MVGDYYQNHELKYPMIVKIIKDIVNNKLKFSLFCRILYFYRLLVVVSNLWNLVYHFRCELCIYKSKLFRVISYDFLM